MVHGATRVGAVAGEGTATICPFGGGGRVSSSVGDVVAAQLALGHTTASVT